MVALLILLISSFSFQTSINLTKLKEKFTSPNEQQPPRYDRPRPEFTCNVAYIQAVNYVRRGKVFWSEFLIQFASGTKSSDAKIFLSSFFSSLGRRQTSFKASLQAVQWSGYGMQTGHREDRRHLGRSHEPVSQPAISSSAARRRISVKSDS